MSTKKPKAARLGDWETLAEKELRGRALEELTTHTPEGLAIKPVYTSEDVPDSAAGETPGFAPFTRGVRDIEARTPRVNGAKPGVSPAALSGTSSDV